MHSLPMSVLTHTLRQNTETLMDFVMFKHLTADKLSVIYSRRMM